MSLLPLTLLENISSFKILPEFVAKFAVGMVTIDYVLFNQAGFMTCFSVGVDLDAKDVDPLLVSGTLTYSVFSITATVVPVSSYDACCDTSAALFVGAFVAT